MFRAPQVRCPLSHGTKSIRTKIFLTRDDLFSWLSFVFPSFSTRTNDFPSPDLFRSAPLDTRSRMRSPYPGARWQYLVHRTLRPDTELDYCVQERLRTSGLHRSTFRLTPPLASPNLRLYALSRSPQRLPLAVRDPVYTSLLHLRHDHLPLSFPLQKICPCPLPAYPLHIPTHAALTNVRAHARAVSPAPRRLPPVSTRPRWSGSGFVSSVYASSAYGYSASRALPRPPSP
ncbi:hypothetical protein HYPSUDRAFT_208828 [Hypholoma sublateritium FD-334 SS-4]|uniref:Uncharacterized protein n=1 Tax=Hypholoma sublateritium (strain FD-334 SS-4) TaxID=945553 RepID=A0A0D2LTX2_HYPSF|nr:hypothetical protein HYPSUDRAFT_208828 [Hypholoma sublateritium FD-334 SS-4]